MSMGRWTELQKELNGHKRKLAYKKHEVSLKTAPWEDEDEQEHRSDQRLDTEDADADR